MPPKVSAPGKKGIFMKLLSILIATVAFLGACVEQPQEGAAARSNQRNDISSDEVDGWTAELLEHRRKKDEEFRTSITSPMAGIQYLMSEPRDTIYLTRKNDTFGIAYVAVRDAILMINKERDRWYWYDQGWNVICERNGEQLPNGAPLEDSVRFRIDHFTATPHPRTNQVAFIVFDPQRPEKKSFEHLVYFPPDKKYAVPAQLIEFSEYDEVTMLTNQNLEKVFYRYGKIEFELEGKEQELTVFKYELSGEKAETLFVPFKDATTVKESYGAGRFLEFPEPKEKRFVLDFNRSFNPSCNYSPAYNCPIPPKENHLEVAIRAGEKTYPTMH
jgi:uncharacterized protein (DUF1684 family)